MLADEMGEFLGTRTVREVRAEMAVARPVARRPRVRAGRRGPATCRASRTGTLVLATWRHLLDRGSLQDGEPFLAGTAPAARRPAVRVDGRRPRRRRRRRADRAGRRHHRHRPGAGLRDGRPRRLAADQLGGQRPAGRASPAAPGAARRRHEGGPRMSALLAAAAGGLDRLREHRQPPGRLQRHPALADPGQGAC